MARIGNKKAFTVHLSDEMAAMIDLKRKEWGLRSRGEVIERLLGWMVEPSELQNVQLSVCSSACRPGDPKNPVLV